MIDDELLRFDADLIRIGDRVASSGWPLLAPASLRVTHADASGITEFPNSAVAYGPSHAKSTLVINGREIEGRPVLLDDDYLVGLGPVVDIVEPHRAVLDDFLRLADHPTDAAI